MHCSFWDIALIQISLLIVSEIVNTAITLGEYLEFTICITGNERVIIDYIIYYPNKTQKVFKFKQLDLQGSGVIAKKHLFKAMTTKKLYSGEYMIVLQINGQVFDDRKFLLTV